MPGFGPFYPQRLQVAINHAERLSTVLRSLPGPVDDEASPWVIGRADEIACLVDAVTREWTAGRLDEDRAAAEVDAYVDELHIDLCARLGQRPLPCCGAEQWPTREAVPLPGASTSATASLPPGVTTLLRGLDFPVAEPRR